MCDDHICVWVTCDGCPAHEVCVGEVQGGVELEVRLDNPSCSLTGIVEQTSAPHWHSALVSVLEEKRVESINKSRGIAYR